MLLEGSRDGVPLTNKGAGPWEGVAVAVVTGLAGVGGFLEGVESEVSTEG